ncbi:MAG: hypothetical protein EB164_04610, partial [Thaumarchaeota archaeon]|nr:hypothetical protein [Nitrososphaerota archaeon]
IFPSVILLNSGVLPNVSWRESQKTQPFRYESIISPPADNAGADRSISIDPDGLQRSDLDQL